jgi:hypothetical protein
LFKTPHKDEAINQMVEISAKDYLQRIKIIACEVDEKGVPIVDAHGLVDTSQADASPIAAC